MGDAAPGVPLPNRSALVMLPLVIATHSNPGSESPGDAALWLGWCGETPCLAGSLLVSAG